MKTEDAIRNISLAIRNRNTLVIYSGNHPEHMLKEIFRRDPKLLSAFEGYRFQKQRGKTLLSAASYTLQFNYDPETPPYEEIILDDGTWCLTKAWENNPKRELYVIVTENPSSLVSRLNDDMPKISKVCPVFRQLSCSQRNRKYSSLVVCYLKCEYAFSSRQMENMENMANQTLDRVVSQVFAFRSEYMHQIPEAVRAYLPYSYLQQNVTFVEQPLDMADKSYDSEADTLYGVFSKRKGSAVGLANAYKSLAEKMGLECQLIQGYAGTGNEWPPHTWCLVRINGFFHHVDPTFGINGDTVCVDGFLKSDREMKSTHQWDTMKIPECSLRTPSYHEVYQYIENHYEDLLHAGVTENIICPDNVDW